MAAATEDLASHRKALILGSGLLRDVPLDLLRTRFREVVCLDAVHLLPARLKTRGRGVTRVVADLTGLAESIPDGTGKRADAMAGWRADPELDLVVSANVLSQLAMAPAAWAERRGSLPTGLPSDLEARIVGWHLADLAAFRCPVCLLTDVAYRERRRDGSEAEPEDLLHGHRLPPPDAVWDWNVAPIGEISREVAHVHRVHAYRDLARAG